MTKHVGRLGMFMVASACIVALAGCSGGDRTVVVSDTAAAPTITVTAESELKVVPDKAQISVAVTTQAASAADTYAQNADRINAVTDALKAMGIDEKSIQTAFTSLNPRYDYAQAYDYTLPMEPEATDTESADAEASDVETTGTAQPGTEATSATATDAATAGEEIAIAPAEEADARSTNIVGYEMTTNLTVKDLDIDKVGEVLQACVAAGANNTDGIQYYSSEYDATYAKALAAAVDAAREKAEVLAKASGTKLGAVYSVTEGYQNTAYRYDTSGAAMAMDAASEKALAINPGEIDVSASVTVSYEIA